MLKVLVSHVISNLYACYIKSSFSKHKINKFIESNSIDLSEDLNLRIKNSNYGIEELVQNKEIAEKYAGGVCLINRRSVDDYHRYHHFDNGTIGETKKINGVLHTVKQIAHEKYKVFAENSREWTILHTENFRDVIQIEV